MEDCLNYFANAKKIEPTTIVLLLINNFSDQFFAVLYPDYSVDAVLENPNDAIKEKLTHANIKWQPVFFAGKSQLMIRNINWPQVASSEPIQNLFKK